MGEGDHAILESAQYEGLRFTIETEGVQVGLYFLWASRAGKDIDELCGDTIDECKTLALEKYCVPIASWIKH